MSASDSSPSADRNLLFGILALQMDFVSRDALIKAMHAWVLQKSTPLGQILLDQGALRPDTHALLEAMVQKHLDLHGGDAQKSLASVSSLGSARQQLEQIADADLHQSLAHVAANRVLSDDPLATRPPTVGEPTSAGQRFRILRPHAEGGLGKVFVAHDGELRREVALKEIKDRHADDPDKRLRFLLEAEITGGLEHPGIVPVYGLGQYADGRPFYAMRFIRGDSLQDAIARFHRADTPGRDAGERTLALRKLLGRFLDVCNAIAYAHARGVLHRDLKPGNVMLGKYGETLVVDWGLAKPLGRVGAATETMEGPLQPSSASGSNPTQMGSAIGTPAYMPPEQAAGRLDQLGPASDVYSLGATLYCLLAGAAPFEGTDIGAMLRQVEHGEFRPPRQVKPSVPAALEAVCLKAMALKPEDRYASPRALAEDIEHWLADEPVSAWREPWRARARRWVSRHRTLVTAAAATLLVATVCLTLATVLLQAANNRERQEKEAKETALRDAEANAAEAKRQEKEALEQKRQAETNAAEAKRQEKEAKEQAEIAQAVNDFLQNDLLRQADSTMQAHRHFTPDPDVKVRTLLDRAAAGIDQRFADKPLLAAAIRKAIGDAYIGVGEYHLAIKHLSVASDFRVRHLGPDHPETLATLDNLATAYRAAGRTADAIKLHEQVRESMTKKLGADHPYTLTTLDNLATAYRAAGRTADAIKLHEQVRESMTKKLGADHPKTLATLNNLALAYRAAGRTAEAIQLFEQVRESVTKKLGADHPDTLTTLDNLAGTYRVAGRTAEAIKLYEQVRESRIKKLGADHPNTLTTLGNLAGAYQYAGRTDEAIQLFEQVRKSMTKKLGADHPKTLTTLNNLASSYLAAGRTTEAIQLFEQVRVSMTKKLGADHPSTLNALFNLAYTLQETKQFNRALPLYRQLLDSHSRKFPKDHPVRAVSLASLGLCLLQAGKPAEAEPLLRECLSIREKKQPDVWVTFNTHSMLGDALLGQKKYIEAEPLLVQGYEGMKARQDKVPPQAKVRPPEALERLVRLYDATGKTDEADDYRKKLEAERAKSSPKKK